MTTFKATAGDPTQVEADLLIFDLDGTLVDSRYDIAHSLNETLRLAGVPPLPFEVIEAEVGTGVGVLLEDTLRKGGVVDVAAAVGRFDDLYLKHLADRTRPYERMEDVLAHFAATPKVVLTNKRGKFAEPLLERLGLARHFEGVLGRDAFPTRKPDPGPVLGICARFGVKPPRAVVIGDTDVDIRAGKGAGARTCGVLFGYGVNERLLASGPDVLVATPWELTARLRGRGTP